MGYLGPPFQGLNSAPSEDSDQPGHTPNRVNYAPSKDSPAWAYAQSDQSLSSAPETMISY